MSLRKWLERIASANQVVRRRELLKILREIDCPYVLYRDKIDGIWTENIVVSFHPGKPRLVIGAHYDSVRGSTGANDNAAAVCILLKMAEYYLEHPPEAPVDLVFFDLEEGGAAGSRAFVRRFRKQAILSMINLDICGVGDTILAAPRKNLRKNPLRSIVRHPMRTANHAVRIVDALPKGDEASFEIKGIPNVTACIVPRKEANMVEGFARGMHQKRKPHTVPPIVETMHNGRRDSVGVVKEKSMRAVFQWALATVKGLEGLTNRSSRS